MMATRWQKIKKYQAGKVSNSIMLIPSFKKTGKLMSIVLMSRMDR
jgi:hypothetical protein